MIQVQVVNAENLPVPTKSERKTKIFCFSTSACHYFYDAYKNDLNTRNPTWNCTFDVDLFRCSILTFRIYSSRLLSRDIFLGSVEIDFFTFLNQSPGDEILKDPYGSVSCGFPLTSCSSHNAILNLSFLYVPKVYPPIQIKEISKPFIHIWTTFTPSPPNIENIVEVELLQALTIKEKKNEYGFYFHFNKFYPWESVGYSSSSKSILGQTGYTQIHTLFPERISGKYNFFILNVGNYSGIVTLNFVAEKSGKQKFLKEGTFQVPKTRKPQIGTIKTIDVHVEPNKKYCVPLYFFYEKKFFSEKIEFNEFPLITANMLTNSEENDQKTDFTDFMSYENMFNSAIIEVAPLNDVHFLKTFVMPTSEKVSIQKLFQEFDIQFNSKIRIYINGSTTHNSGNNSHTDFWTPSFVIYDNMTGQRCPEISKELKKKPKMHTRFFDKNVLGNDWHYFVDLNLDEIGIDKTIVFNIYCVSTLESACPPGMLLITHVNADNGDDDVTILMRNVIYTDSCDTRSACFFRLEFIEDSWFIIPMRLCCKEGKKLDFILDSLYRMNWEMDQSLIDKMKDKSHSDSSDEEILLEEVNSNLI